MFVMDNSLLANSPKPFQHAEAMDSEADQLPSLGKRKRGLEIEDTKYAFSALSVSRLQQLALPTPGPSSAASFSSSFPADATTLPSSPAGHAADTHDAKRIRPLPRPRASRNISLASSNLSSPAAPYSSPNTAVSDAASAANAAAAMTALAAVPCGSCHRRPSTRQDVPAYADCALCGGRACPVCARACEAAGCGAVSCPRCCHEVGRDGFVWCNRCYLADDDAGPDAWKAGRSKAELQAEGLGRIADWLLDCTEPTDEGDLGYAGDCEA